MYLIVERTTSRFSPYIKSNIKANYKIDSLSEKPNRVRCTILVKSYLLDIILNEGLPMLRPSSLMDMALAS